MVRTTEADGAAKLYTDYVYMNNVLASGIHTGNMADIYVNDPLNISEATTTISDLGTKALNLTPGGLQSSTITFPISEIVDISVGGTLLTRGTDYTVVQNNPELAYSNRGNLSINLADIWANSDCEVTYRYYNHGEGVQTLMDSDTFRAPGVDNLAKITPPTIVSIDVLDYKGGLAPENMKTVLAEWINARTDTLEVSDLVNFLYSQNANFVDLATLDIRVDSYNFEGSQLQDGERITSTHTLSGMAAFYTHVNNLTLTKLA